MDTALRDKENELTQLLEEKLKISSNFELLLLESKNNKNNNIDLSTKTKEVEAGLEEENRTLKINNSEKEDALAELATNCDKLKCDIVQLQDVEQTLSTKLKSAERQVDFKK